MKSKWLVFLFLVSIPVIAAGSLIFVIKQTPEPPDAVGFAAADNTRFDPAVQFRLRCGTCHGAQGKGGSGPDLTNNSWKYSTGSAESIAEIITYGIKGTQMPGWGHKLRPKDIQAIAIYVQSLNQ